MIVILLALAGGRDAPLHCRASRERQGRRFDKFGRRDKDR
jgi:hypothetical protein